MSFDLFWLDFYWTDKLFGFGLFSVKNPEKEIHRSLLAVYWSDGAPLLDLFWFRILTY